MSFLRATMKAAPIGTVRCGPGLPAASLGAQGDLYLSSTTRQVYLRGKAGYAAIGRFDPAEEAPPKKEQAGEVTLTVAADSHLVTFPEAMPSDRYDVVTSFQVDQSGAPGVPAAAWSQRTQASVLLTFTAPYVGTFTWRVKEL